MEKIELVPKIKFINENKDYKFFYHSITDVTKGYGQYNNSSGWSDCGGTAMGEGVGSYSLESGEGYGIDEEQGIVTHGIGDGCAWEDNRGEG